MQDVETRGSAVSRAASVILSYLLVGTAVAVLSYFAYAIYRTHTVVEESLPCEPDVITNTNPIIDPAGYSLYPEEEVEASKAWETCMAESRALFAGEGITKLSNNVYGPLIGMADVGAAILTLAGWTIAVVGRVSRSRLYGLAGLTSVGLIAFASQLRFTETIDVVTRIVD